ncbi:serine hydrolase domain-containing protein [Pseudomonas sp. BN515]|uniref:serine hydrolase domain-containing protein n=1 Tax=Pseudomonas sp. BN515 TaxID=2567892 RepID=UPI002453D827|nr:serine hydrolase domain-containing protein [Pseudomonas sp. BN515]MDH4874427.1 beta-lactamase family protein [Pseudomonas sp. BN515]
MSTATLKRRYFAEERLQHLRSVIEQDVARGDYHGAVIRVSLGDQIGLDLAIGSADADQTKPLARDSVFSIFSLTKALTNVLALRAVELGRLALTTRVIDIIPEFKGTPREHVTLYHLLTHTTGMPGVWIPKADMYQDRLDELVQAVCDNVHGTVPPGQRCDYSPVANQVLIGEMLRRTDPQGRSFNDLIREDLFEPLGMRDTNMGVRPDLRSRKVVPDMRGVIPIKCLGRTQPGPFSLFEEEVCEAPHVGAVSTTADMWRFAEMLRCGGELDGVRILSPRMIEVARKNHTGDLYNELYRGVALRAGWYDPPPAYIGLGFSVRGERIVHHQFGTLTSTETFGNYGAGTTMFWIDPSLDLVFTCLTAGVMTQAANIQRFQRLSDLAVSAVV